MKKQAFWIGIILGLLVLGHYQPAQAEDPEKEARAVFTKLVKAAKANNQEEFKSYITKKDLKEMEKEAFVEVMMALVAEENPESFTAEVKGDQIVFRKQIKIDTPQEKSSGETSVHMIKEEGQWKFGKPRNE